MQDQNTKENNYMICVLIYEPFKIISRTKLVSSKKGRERDYEEQPSGYELD